MSLQSLWQPEKNSIQPINAEEIIVNKSYVLTFKLCNLKIPSLSRMIKRILFLFTSCISSVPIPEWNFNETCLKVSKIENSFSSAKTELSILQVTDCQRASQNATFILCQNAVTYLPHDNARKKPSQYPYQQTLLNACGYCYLQL